MRTGLVAIVVLACGPKVSTTPRPIDEDLDMRETAASANAAELSDEQRIAETERSPGHRAKPEAPERRSEGSAEGDVRGDRMKYDLLAAPPGKGLRTGTIARDRLIAVLDAGPAVFLRQFEVTPHM